MTRQKTPFISAIFWIMTAAFILLVGYYAINNVFESERELDVDPSTQWYSENDTLIDFSDRSQFSAIAIDNEFTVSYQPDYYTENACLVFKSYFADVQVYHNGELVYSTDEGSVQNTYELFTSDTPAPKLNFADLGEVSSGDTVTLSVKLYYNDFTNGIGNIVYGDKDDIIIYLNQNSTVGVILCVILFALAVTIFVFNIAFRKIVSSVRGLKYGAFFALFAVLYSACSIPIMSIETYFSSNSLYVLYCLSFALQFLMLLLFFSENVKFRASTALLRVLSVLQAVFIVATAALVAVKLLDFHFTYLITGLFSSVQCLLILAVLIYDFARKRERRNSDLKLVIIYSVFLACVIAGCIVDLYSAIPVVWLLSCIFLAVSVVIMCISTVAKLLDIGSETEAIGKMAFTDGLTGVGNTTAFRKKMAHLELVKVNYKSIGIVQFDINNLKTVNDTLGHDSGDKLITDGAALISKVFGKIGDVYRIGGDEFVAIVCGDNARSLCRDSVLKFEQMMDEYNSDETHKFKLVIAYGSEFYQSNLTGGEITLSDIHKLADVKMYAKKRELKERDKENSNEIR